MTFDFEELDYRPTPIGALSLRRRRELKLGVDVFEIKLGDEFLMSSLFTASEIALARLGLAELSEHGLDVVVGGLGLGYTAKAVLEHQKVASLLVVEALEAVIEWHAEGLVPLGPELTGDLRCRFVQGDFFALANRRRHVPTVSREIPSSSAIAQLLSSATATDVSAEWRGCPIEAKGKEANS